MARRRRKGKAGKWVGRSLSALLAVPALYLARRRSSARWSRSIAAGPSPREGTTVYIADNGIHADIIMPVNAEGVDWAPLFPKSDFAAPRSGRALDRLRVGRAASLSRHADVVGYPAAHDLVRRSREVSA